MNSADDVWQAVLKLLEQHLTPTAIGTWFTALCCTPAPNSVRTSS